MTTLQHVTPDVDALDPDAPAAAQLTIDSERAGLDAHMHVTHPHGGPTRIHFDSREDFLAVVAYGLIHADPNPYHTIVDLEAGLVRVPATHGWPYAWNAEATYPTQPDVETCPGCGGDTGHWDDCTDRTRIDFAAAAAIPVVVVDLPRRTPGKALVHYGTTDVPYACEAVQGAYSPFMDAVTCPDCAVVLAPPLPRRTPGAALVGNPPLCGMVFESCCVGDETWTCVKAAGHEGCHSDEPLATVLRDAYSDVRAAEARELASALTEEKSGE